MSRRRGRVRVAVSWDGEPVRGVRRAGPLTRTVQVVEVRDGSDGVTHRVPGEVRPGPVTLTRRLTEDRAFQDWADLLASGPAAGVPLAHLRREVRVVLSDRHGPVAAYTLHRAWPSGYEVAAGGPLRGGRRPVERLTLECDGWTREPAPGA